MFKPLSFVSKSTIKRMFLYVTILVCQIIYIPYIVIVLYTLYWYDHFPYPYGFAILYGSTEINDMIRYDTDVLIQEVVYIMYPQYCHWYKCDRISLGWLHFILFHKWMWEASYKTLAYFCHFFHLRKKKPVCQKKHWYWMLLPWFLL
jgi:hypothetical protein